MKCHLSETQTVPMRGSGSGSDAWDTANPFSKLKNGGFFSRKLFGKNAIYGKVFSGKCVENTGYLQACLPIALALDVMVTNAKRALWSLVSE
jgi:hypothetical protein